MKVLICDPIAEKGIELLRKRGIEVSLKGNARVEDVIDDSDGVIVRSATKITSDVIERGEKLR